jgi:cytochrome c-type biogenesis protein CcmH/NrfF
VERHRIDALSLVFGLVFVAVGLLLLSGGPALGHNLPMQWVGPMVAIGLGVVLFLAARPEREAEPPQDGDAVDSQPRSS